MHDGLIKQNSFQAVAGHSLGEYSALVANESILFEESVNLLKIRSRAMQESMPIGTGGMVAIIGCDDKEIDTIINKASKFGKVYIANDNSNGQIVLSGEIESIKFISDNAKNLKIRKAILIPVSAPFHCELMTHASEILSNEIEKIKFRKFKSPLYSNVTSNICNEAEIADLLVKQVVSKVRWREIIQNMIRDEFKRFIEIGPGNVLTNLVKRISRNVESISISSLKDLDKLKN